jgi:amino acid transporter
MLGEPGFAVMSVLTVVAAFTTANAEMAALPRMLYGMAQEDLVPSQFGYIHPRFRTPWVGVLFTAGLMSVTTGYATIRGAVVDVILFLILTAVIAWMVSYALAMIDVIVMRLRYPNFPRLWSAPGGSFSMIIGLAGVVYAIWTLKQYWVSAGVYMLAIGIYCYAWLRYKNLPLWETQSLAESAQRIIERTEDTVDREWENAVEDWMENKGYEPGEDEESVVEWFRESYAD